jgi:putative phage-type endonuclease
MKPWNGLEFHAFQSRDEWLAKRLEMGVGGSESAAILGLSPYSCSAQVFYEKLGFARKFNTSLPMIIGNEDEAKIAKLWSYYDSNFGVESIPVNYMADKVIRKPIKLSRILVNPKHPFLFANPDRLFKNGKERSILEIKTINHWESQKWESGVPIHYIIQIQHYMLVCEVKYAELAILEANNKIDVIPFEPSKEIQERIIEKCGSFWNDVLEARKILAAGGMELDIQHLVPPPDGSDAYTDFLKEKYKESSPDPELTVTATESDLMAVANYFRYKSEIEDLSKQMALAEQMLREKLGEAPVLDFGEQYGRITWRADKNGRRTFKTNGIKKEEVLAQWAVDE